MTDPINRRWLRPAAETGGMLRWELGDMLIDDELIVPSNVLPYEGAYDYVKKRQSITRRWFKVERIPEGTLVTRVEFPEQAKVGKKALPRPMNGDWGTITKEFGKRWHFPFEHMKPGDTFRVHILDIKEDALEGHKQRAQRKTGSKFKIISKSIMGPEWHIVRCVSQTSTGHEYVNFDTIRMKVGDCYEGLDESNMVDPPRSLRLSMDKANENGVSWQFLKIGESISVPAKMLVDSERKSFVFRTFVSSPEEPVATDARFAVDLHDGHIYIERLSPDMTMNDWIMEKELRETENPFA